ncbi:hypothetical protein CERSUDRAFT_101017 [Gelatoporia subvermispora B]|uniref:C2H2-type domain-containing protein n=1 Tax=Ceriporiopsis subvermispora (strain B) TaxID=914234 RepID=M2QFF9_CERS8|nr:hypothetical protein CERSUDRAFT_101017 [Gelatoporia subvermispora B]
MALRTLAYPQFFSQHPRHKDRWRCELCPDSAFLTLSRALRHEDLKQHLNPSDTPSSLPLPDFEPSTGGSRLDPQVTSFFQDWEQSLHGPALPDDPPDQLYDDWEGVLAANSSDPFEQPMPDHAPDDASSSSDEHEYVPSSDPYPYDLEQLQRDLQHAPDGGQLFFDDEDWWPWIDRKHALLDIMGGFPRSLFSEAELDAVKRHRERIANVAGVEPRTHDGALGNLYTTLDWYQIVKHEFANPLVRPHLHVYPEDSGTTLHEARQGRRWLHEMPADVACPMARSDHGLDFFVNELALVLLDPAHGPIPVLVERWFMRAGTLLARVRPVLLTDQRRAFIIDAREHSSIDVKLKFFYMSVVELLKPETQLEYHLPRPDHVAGVLVADHTPLKQWTVPVLNLWRIRANGKRVLSLPLWLYCDDTSGNSSKKWNKHNSILFTLAGLPRRLSQLMYNIHFLATSNIAPPLEMVEQLVDVLRDAHASGWEVWDSYYNEVVLLLPWILAFLGDNPMASEFASHIGMNGKFFCRENIALTLTPSTCLSRLAGAFTALLRAKKASKSRPRTPKAGK